MPNMRLLSICWFLAVAAASCLLPGGRKVDDSRRPQFLEKEAELQPSGKVRDAWLDPAVDLSNFDSIRIPDFIDYTGEAIHEQAGRIMADSVAEELERFPPNQRPFGLIDRSPATAAAWVDLTLEGAITIYEVRSDVSGRDRLSDQVTVGIECRLVRNEDGKVIAMIRHRSKEKVAFVGYDNPIRASMHDIASGVASFLSQPDLKPAK